MKTRIESLESRIAPAALLAGGKGITYVDLDGDLVTVKFSKGQVSATDFTFDTSFDFNGPQQLQLINLSDDGQEFANASITVTAQAAGGVGNKLANVGYLNASGVDLAVVKIAGDLGRISVGDEVGATLGLKSLNVESLGLYGTSTQAAGGNLRTFVKGGLGSLQVISDVVFAEINASNAADQMLAPINSVKIGGSLIGGGSSFSGQIYSTGSIGKVSIGGDLVGGPGASSGQISAGTSLGSVTLGGDLIGGSYSSPVVGSAAGAIISGRNTNSLGPVGFVKIGGSIIGGSGDYSGLVVVGAQGDSDLGSLMVGRDIIGNGDFAGVVSVSGKVTTATIGGDIRGGAGEDSGSLDATRITRLSLGGDLIGSAGENSGQVSAYLAKSITIGGSVIGGDVATAGALYTSGVGNLTIKGDILSGDGTNSARVIANGANVITVYGSLIGAGSDHQSALLVNGSANLITVRGSIFSSSNYNAGIEVTGHVNSLSIAGSVKSGVLTFGDPLLEFGSAGRISIGGDLVGKSGYTTLAIGGDSDRAVDLGQLKIGGSMDSASIVGGELFSDGVAIGNISVGKDFNSSRIAVNTSAGGDNIYGTTDDLLDESDIGSIASIVIKGQALGTPAFNMDSYHIVAHKIASVTVHGVKLNLGNSTTVPLGSTGDMVIRQSAMV